MNTKEKPLIGFIGQGWIGKNYANDFENRNHTVVRYALEEPYVQNKGVIKTCDIVFIAVPTPTTPDGFDETHLRTVLPLVGEDKIAVIKSTLLPGTTDKLQKEFPAITIFHSPEFLVEKTAAHDAAHPSRNIIGIPKDTAENRKRAEQVLKVLPDAPYQKVMSANDAEFVKYAGNCFLFTKVVFMNLLYDLVRAQEGDWSTIREALIHDPRIGISHTQPISSSRHGSASGRGAGGHCLIKDFEAYRSAYAAAVGDEKGNQLLTALAEKNIELLVESGKDIELLSGVYGDILGKEK